MASVMLIIGFLMASLAIAGAQSIGVCYGRDANNLPPPSEVVALYRQYNIGRMRIYDPNPEVLQALRGSNIELVLGVPNRDLENLANNPSAAASWVQTNVRSYHPDVRFRYIAVGNEVTRNAQNFVVRAMTNVYNAVQGAGLGQIKVSTVIDTSVIADDSTYPPSRSVFKSELMWLLNPIIGFLTDTRAPLLVNVFPYFSYYEGSPLKLSFGLFTNQSPEFTDNNLQYYNLFDAELDGVYAALAKASGSSLRAVVSEIGWSSKGFRNVGTIGNAHTFNQNLIRHVKSGTPRKPGEAIETYVFAMFNENLKSGGEQEQNFGLFYPNKHPVYDINFS